jgi:hypothetical protein
MSYRRKSPEAFVEELKSVLAASAAGNIQLASRLNALVKQATSREQGRGRVPPDRAEVLSRLLDFQLAAYSVVTTHSLAMLDGLISSAERALLGTGAESVDSGPPPGARDTTETALQVMDVPDTSSSLRREGRVGDRLTCPFLVENQYDRSLDVSFEAEPLAPGSGPSLPGSLVSFDPATITLPSRGQAVAQAVVELTEDFVVGETYTTALNVLGFQAPPVRLAITVLPPAAARGARARPTEIETPQPVRRARPARRRRTTSTPTS